MTFYLMERGWMDNDAFKGERVYTERTAWVWLIEHAAWKDTRSRIDSKMVPVARGQILTSLRSLGGAWGWHRNRVQRFLKLLVSEQMIGTELGTGQTLITLCNYAKYQNPSNKNGTEPQQETGRERDGRGTHKKEGKEVEEDSEAKASGADAPSDPLKALFDLGVEVLGPSSRSLIGKARKQHGDLVTMEALLACKAASPSQPVEFFIGCLKQRGSAKQSPVEKLYEGAFRAAERWEREHGETNIEPSGAVVIPLLDSRRSSGGT